MNYDNLFYVLAAESSRNEKIRILLQYKDDNLLKEIIRVTLDPFTNFWIKQIPSYTCSFGSMNLSDAIAELTKLSDRTYTGNAGIDWLKNILEHTIPQDAAVIERIIHRDLFCGVSVSTVNKIWPGLIAVFPVMLCSAHSDALIAKIKYPAIVQKKEDGMRFNAIVLDGSVTFFSRVGKPIDLLGNLEDEFVEMAHGSDVVYDGELLIADEDGIILNRQTGNGILNKAVKGTILGEEAAMVRAVVWDRIPYADFLLGKCPTIYMTRFGCLWDDFLHNQSCNKKTFRVESQVVANFAEVESIFAKYLERGDEGIILKDVDSIWENKRSRKQIKLKGIEECDLLCTDVIPGKGKYSGMIGGLFCETWDGFLTVTVGSGLSDEMRSWDKQEFIGKIITVKYNQRITDKYGKESLFLPTFLEVREDKTTADGVASIK